MAITKQAFAPRSANCARLLPRPGYAALGIVISGAADSIENSLEQVRKQHQLTTSQFLVEIRMLHNASMPWKPPLPIDEVTRFATREELAERICSSERANTVSC